MIVIMLNDFPFKENYESMSGVISVDMKNDICPVVLPEKFKWDTISLDNQGNAGELIAFLSQNYSGTLLLPSPVYTQDQLRWIFTSDQYLIICVRTKNNNMIVGTIAAVPIAYKIDYATFKTYQVGLLCTHKKLRKKKIAHVLVKELYRRLDDQKRRVGILFNANNYEIPKAISIVEPVRLLCRPLNIVSLRKNLFSGVSEREFQGLSKAYDVKSTRDIELFRKVNKTDMCTLMDIYHRDSQKKYRMVRTLNYREFEHMFMSDHGVVQTYMITNSAGDIKDFVSFYVVHTNDGRNHAHLLHVTYPNLEILEVIMINILYIAKQQGYDMFYAMDIFGIGKVLTDRLKFKDTNALFNSYVLNYDTEVIQRNHCGLVGLI